MADKILQQVVLGENMYDVNYLITLFVDGKIIVGELVPEWAFMRWAKSIYSADSNFAKPEQVEITPELIEAVKYLHIRPSKIVGANFEPKPDGPMYRIDLDSVTGWTFGDAAEAIKIK